MDSQTSGSSELGKNGATSATATYTASSLRIRELLASCSSSVESGGFLHLEGLVTELVNFLSSLSEDVALDPGNKDLENNVYQVLAEILAFLSSTQPDQALIDALSFELPKAVSKFTDISSRCLQIVDSIVDRFVATCSPRDMLSILCEVCNLSGLELASVCKKYTHSKALDSPVGSIRSSCYAAPLLRGLSKVFISIQRRHYEQLKVAVPIVLKVLKDISLETDVELEDLFDNALGVANSIREVYSKLKREENEKLRALLGLYVLQIMALFSVSIREKVATYLPLVAQLASFLTYCGFTCLGLITGSDVDRVISIVAGDDEDDFISSFPDINLGASLSVVWGKISDEVAQASNPDLTTVENELQSDQLKRWQVYGMLKYILSSSNLLWELRRHAIEFLLDITNEVASSHCDDGRIDCLQYTPSIYTALQAVTLVIMYAPDADLRKKTFDVLKRVLSDIPNSRRFEVLRALVTNSQSSSMAAILLDLVKDNMRERSLQAEDCSCAGTHVLELVELVLRPPEGGPPILPEQGDAVLAALNLYRFALLVESKGKNACTGVLSKKNLREAYDKWLLPLRTLVSGIMAENRKDDDELAVDTVCSLNPIEVVLYRCIELVEENFKNST